MYTYAYIHIYVYMYVCVIPKSNIDILINMFEFHHGRLNRIRYRK